MMVRPLFYEIGGVNALGVDHKDAVFLSPRGRVSQGAAVGRLAGGTASAAEGRLAA